MEDVKQVIVFRKDLLKGQHSIRKGKFAAQVAHASVASLLKCFNKQIRRNYSVSEDCICESSDKIFSYECHFTENSVLDKWLNGKFKKVVVSVDTEEELLDLFGKLEDTDIPHALITDCGLTEFNGVHTNTCIGIGPYISQEIDKFTGDLNLL